MAENTIPAVEKAVAVLTRLGESEGGLTQAELAAALDIAPSSCYRILQTLLEADWVCKIGGTRYDLSFGILGAVRKLTDRNARYEAMLPVLEELAAQTGLCCKLSVRRGEFQLPILRAESPRPMAVSGRVGVRFPVAEGSVGAALLAAAPAAEGERLGQSCAGSPGGGEAPELVRDGIAAIRRRGFCFNRGRNRWRVDAMSSPVLDAEGGVIAALTLLGCDEDFRDDKLPELAGKLLDGVKKCERIYNKEQELR